MTRTSDGELHYEWGMGTDDFLTPGSDMEVFLDEDDGTGLAGTLAIAGLPGHRRRAGRVRDDLRATVVEGQVHTRSSRAPR